MDKYSVGLNLHNKKIAKKKQTIITTDCFCATGEREGAIFNSHGDFVVEN